MQNSIITKRPSISGSFSSPSFFPAELTNPCPTHRDLRTLSLSQTYSEAHSDDLTTLSFHPTLPHVLLSASVDGLINTYDVRVVDEDDALLTTAKAGASLGDAGWMPLPSASENGEFKGIWGVTTIETLQLWDAEEVSGALAYGL